MPRFLCLTAVLCLVAGCESAGEQPPSPDPTSASASASKVPVAAPDAPIENGARVPRTAEGKSIDDAPDPATSPATSPATDPATSPATDPATSPATDPAAGADLTQAMSRLAQRYSGGWIAASPAFDGELAQGQHQDYQLLLGSVHCYRVLGVADPSVEDLDLLLFDPSGVQVQEDQGSDRFPVVGLGYPVCPPSAGAYRLQVRAPSGSGTFQVQAFHTP